jgi:hypothetical protein
MKELIYILIAVGLLVGAFAYVDYSTGQAIKQAQLGALGL